MSDCVGATPITILSDNQVNEGPVAVHDLSIWVEAAVRRVLASRR
jgi:hypothetical protein